MEKEKFINSKMELSKEDIIYDYYNAEEELIEKLDIEHKIYELEQQCKKQQEIIDKGINYCHSQIDKCKYEQSDDEWECCIEELKGILQILEDKEV